MVTRMFKDQIGKAIKVYIDDMVVKMRKSEGHVRDLVEVFEILQQHKLCLNAIKYAFGVGSGKCRDLVFAVRENDTDTGVCYKETAALFPSTYGVGIDRVPLAIAFDEVGFHWEDS